MARLHNLIMPDSLVVELNHWVVEKVLDNKHTKIILIYIEKFNVKIFFYQSQEQENVVYVCTLYDVSVVPRSGQGLHSTIQYL